MNGKKLSKNIMSKEKIIELIKENCKIKDINEDNLSKYYAKVMYIY